MSFRTQEKTSVARVLAGNAQKMNDSPQKSLDDLLKKAAKRECNDSHLKETLKVIYDQECLYGVTITFSPKKKFPVSLITDNDNVVKLGDLSINFQFILTAAYLKQLFKSFHFLLFEEYTKKGLIHWHGVVWHPIYKIPNSKVKTVLKGKLKRCGKANLNNQSIDIVNDIDAWSEYILKESGNFICSAANEYDLDDNYAYLENNINLKMLKQIIQQKNEVDVSFKYSKSILDYS